jgi:lysophospholipase L1-like esterase
MQNLNITLIGDSIAKGITTVNSKLGKVENCASKLIENYLGTKINNLSVYGQTIKRVQEKQIIENYIENLNPNDRNVVVFSIGGNDSDYNWNEVAECPLIYHESKTNEKDFVDILTKMINKLKNRGVDVWLTGLPLIHSERYFKNMISRVADSDVVLKFFRDDITNIQRHQELYNFLLYKTAIKNDCKFLDIRSIFLRKRDFLSDYCQDGVHPNEQGHQEIAKEIIRQLDEYGVKPVER